MRAALSVVHLMLATLVVFGIALPCSAHSRGTTSIFFSNRPALLPDGLVALKVWAPADAANYEDTFDVKILEPSDGVRGRGKIRIKIDRLGEEDSGDLGVANGPAYVFGVFERGGSVVYFHAFRLRRSMPDWRHGRTPESFIVDPATVAQAKARR